MNCRVEWIWSVVGFGWGVNLFLMLRFGVSWLFYVMV